MINIFIVAGARPNFMKIAPIIHEIQKNKDKIKYKLIHTGQHYDKNMSGSFFEELGIPTPDINLGISGGSVSNQIGKIIIKFDEILKKERPDYLIVVGDVNSTTACAIAGKQNGIKVIHVEAGLRSFDMTMPEEINRMLTDSISDLLLVSESSGLENLQKEGKGNKIKHVGNIMIDSLINNIPNFEEKDSYKKHGLEKNSYCLITLHRPSNVDTKETLEPILNYFNKLSEKIKCVFPLHPRTKNNMAKLGLENILDTSKITILGPQGYHDFMNLTSNSKFVLTDSGGIQEETTYFQTPCLTMRENTERPSTMIEGTNELVGTDFNLIDKFVDQILKNTYKNGQIPKFWDGKTAERIIDLLLNY